MMIEIQTIEGGQKRYLLTRGDQKKKRKKQVGEPYISMNWSGLLLWSGNMIISMLWSVLMTIQENDGRKNDDQEKDIVPQTILVISTN